MDLSASNHGANGACSNLNPDRLSVDQCAAIARGIESDRNTNDVRLGFAIGTTAVGLVALGLGLYSFASAPSSDHAEARISPLQISVLSGRSTYGLSLSGAF